MEGLLLVYAVVVALELVLSLIMLGVLLMSVAPRGGAAEPAGDVSQGVDHVSGRRVWVTASRVEASATPTPPFETGFRDRGQERFPEDLERSLRVAFRELSRGSRDVALMVHTRALLERRLAGMAAGERG